jgi:5-carboxymethyl-2-hydroxymuconate isomerase
MISPQEIMDVVYKEAEATNLFAKNDIKVRILPFTLYKLGESKGSFLHIFGYIMEGRTTEQKAGLSRQIIERLNTLLPHLSILSINISDFELATYCNKAIINPANTTSDRHFGL